MNCPNCDHPKLQTFETFQTATATLRTKRCLACQWKFTSREEVITDIVIPRGVRKPKEKANGSNAGIENQSSGT